MKQLEAIKHENVATVANLEVFKFRGIMGVKYDLTKGTHTSSAGTAQ
jgi:hypothetical protein